MSGRLLLSNVTDFDVGPLSVRPQQRLIEAAGLSVPVEPLVMQVLVMLGDRLLPLCRRRAGYHRGRAPWHRPRSRRPRSRLDQLGKSPCIDNGHALVVLGAVVAHVRRTLWRENGPTLRIASLNMQHFLKLTFGSDRSKLFGKVAVCQLEHRQSDVAGVGKLCMRGA